MVLAAGLKLAFGKDDKGGGPGGGRGGPGGPGGRAQQVSQVVVAQRPFSDTIEVLGVAKGCRHAATQARGPRRPGPGRGAAGRLG